MSAHGDPSLLPSHIEFERAIYGDVLKMRSEALKETVQAGHDAFNKGQYKEALQKYDKVVEMEPGNVNFKIIWADTLVCLGRFAEAFYVFQNANMLDPGNDRLHHRLSLFYLRRGVIDTADLFMTKASPECKANLSAKIAKVKAHLIQGGKARKDCEWYAALKHVDAMIAEGADSSKPILAFRAEMLLRVGKVDQAEETIMRANALESKLPSLLEFLGMPSESYLCTVYAQIQLVLGKFKIAFSAVNMAQKISNDEINAMQNEVRMMCKAHNMGNNHYKSGNYLKASEEYKVGLKYFKSNVTLLNNLAACHWQLKTWENCIEICNQVLQIRPDDYKALYRRAYSYSKLENWAECVKDYEEATKRFPGDEKFIRALKISQAELEESKLTEIGKEVSEKSVESLKL